MQHDIDVDEVAAPERGQVEFRPHIAGAPAVVGFQGRVDQIETQLKKSRCRDLEKLRPPSIVAVQIGEEPAFRLSHRDVPSGGYTLAAPAEDADALIGSEGGEHRR